MSNLALRFATALVLAPAVVWLLYWDQKLGFLALVALAAVLTALELGAMVGASSKVDRAWIVVGTVLLFAGIYCGVHVSPSSATVLLSFLLVLFVGFTRVLFSRAPVEGADRRMAWSVAGPVYLGAPLAAVALLHQAPNGGGWVLLSMLFAFLSDTGAYFAGRFLGRHKLYEKVSPKKTREGAVGGVLGAVLGAVVAHYWFLPELPLEHGIPLAVLAAAIGQMGDLYASLIKRSSGAKDSGQLLPGHGGMLDRIDALLFTGAVTWAYVTLIA
jgi:phosphatidate cytidylyltransferase